MTTLTLKKLAFVGLLSLAITAPTVFTFATTAQANTASELAAIARSKRATQRQRAAEPKSTRREPPRGR